MPIKIKGLKGPQKTSQSVGNGGTKNFAPDHGSAIVIGLRLQNTSTMREQQEVARGLGVVAVVCLAIVFASLNVKGQEIAASERIEIVTHFDTGFPPGVGAPVCLKGDGLIGRVKDVRLMLGHESTHDLWEVVMDLDARYASKISADSVAYSMATRDGGSNCGSHDRPFVDIGEDSSHLPIQSHTVLEGRVTYAAEIGYILPKSWTQRTLNSITHFIVVDIGIVYVELIGGAIILLAAVVLAILIHRRRGLVR
jgi:hypothetical protein